MWALGTSGRASTGWITDSPGIVSSYTSPDVTRVLGAGHETNTYSTDIIIIAERLSAKQLILLSHQILILRLSVCMYVRHA